MSTTSYLRQAIEKSNGDLAETEALLAAWSNEHDHGQRVHPLAGNALRVINEWKVAEKRRGLTNPTRISLHRSGSVVLEA